MTSVQCLSCGDVITSRHVHDFRYCMCGKLFIDGGNEYLRCGGWKQGGPEEHLRVITDCNGKRQNEPLSLEEINARS